MRDLENVVFADLFPGREQRNVRVYGRKGAGGYERRSRSSSRRGRSRSRRWRWKGGAVVLTLVACAGVHRAPVQVALY